MIPSYELIRSDRKTIAVQVTPALRVIVRAPRRMKTADIEAFVRERTPWIEKHLALMRERQTAAAMAEPIQPFSEAELHALANRALATVPPKVKALAERMGVRYGGITIRAQVSRWGSCSSKGNLNFNCLLMLCPDEVVEYVIVHELCHLRHMNHSKAFWAEVARFCPDHDRHRAWLRTHGEPLIRRLRSGR